MTPELFERQLAHLRRLGVRGGGLAELEAAAAGGGEAPTVFLTFDDGFRDNHETALPLLREYGFPAFVFVLPPLVDEGAPLAWEEVADEQRRHPETMRSMTWEMVGEMSEHGVEVGSHTLSHPHLDRLGPEALRQELSDSRARIVARLGSCETIAYPFGDWSQEVAAAASDCGYRFAFTAPTASGQRAAGPLCIPRINVDFRDAERRLALKLSPLGKELFLSPVAAAMRRRTRALRST